MHGTPDLLTSIAICVIAAAVLGFISNKLRQPLILAYLLAGVVIGPEMGLFLVEDRESINVVSEIGLILLLFIIGLEIDLKKLFAAGRAVVNHRACSRYRCACCLGYGAFYLFGLRDGGGKFPLLYIAICMAISSTLVVVKLLYDKLELDTLPGRITLGVLVFQDMLGDRDPRDPAEPVEHVRRRPACRGARHGPDAVIFSFGVRASTSSRCSSRVDREGSRDRPRRLIGLVLCWS